MNMKYWLGSDFINATITKIQNILYKHALNVPMAYTVLPPRESRSFEVWLMFTEHGTSPYLLAQIADDLKNNNMLMTTIKFSDSAVDAFITLN